MIMTVNNLLKLSQGELLLKLINDEESHYMKYYVVRTQKVFHRLQIFNRHYKIFFTTLMDPFQQIRHILKYKKRWKMSQIGSNCNGKI